MINGEGGGFLLGMSWAEKCEGGGGREENPVMINQIIVTGVNFIDF